MNVPSPLKAWAEPNKPAETKARARRVLKNCIADKKLRRNAI